MERWEGRGGGSVCLTLAINKFSVLALGTCNTKQTETAPAGYRLYDERS